MCVCVRVCVCVCVCYLDKDGNPRDHSQHNEQGSPHVNAVENLLRHLLKHLQHFPKEHGKEWPDGTVDQSTQEPQDDDPPLPSVQTHHT